MAKTKTTAIAAPVEEAEWEKVLREKAKNVQSSLTVGVPQIKHQGSILSIDGDDIAGNKLALIILGMVWVKTYYEKEWVQGSKDTPLCYAFGISEKGLVPHEAVPQKQHDNCTTCPHNKFGTALKGKGKRCGDRPTLLVLLAADLEKKGDVEVQRAIQKAQHYQLQVPPGSIKILGAYASTLNDLTPHGDLSEAITEVSTQGRKGGGYSIIFNHLGNVPKEAMPYIVKRSEGVFETVARPFPVIEAEEAPEPPKPIKGQGKKR